MELCADISAGMLVAAVLVGKSFLLVPFDGYQLGPPIALGRRGRDQITADLGLSPLFTEACLTLRNSPRNRFDGCALSIILICAGVLPRTS